MAFLIYKQSEHVLGSYECLLSTTVFVCVFLWNNLSLCIFSLVSSSDYPGLYYMKWIHRQRSRLSPYVYGCSLFLKGMNMYFKLMCSKKESYSKNLFFNLVLSLLILYLFLYLTSLLYRRSSICMISTILMPTFSILNLQNKTKTNGLRNTVVVMVRHDT